MTTKHLQIILMVLMMIGSSMAGDKIKLKLHQPPPNKIPVASLWKMDIENTTKDNITIYLEGSVTGDKQGGIVKGTSKSINVKPGKKDYKYEDFKSGEVIWMNKSIQEVIIRTGEVPSDVYTICIAAYYENGETADREQCITHHVEKFKEGIITLISPSDGEEVNPETGINFVWTGTGLKGPYTLQIVELKNGQTPEQAFKENRSFYSKDKISNTSFQYSSSAPKFEIGKKYVWAIKTKDVQSDVYSFSALMNSNCDNIQLDLIPIPGNVGCFTFKINTTVGYYNWVKLIYNPAIFSSATNNISGWNVNTNPNSPPFNWISWGGYNYLPAGNHDIGQVCLNTSNLPAVIKYQTSTNSGSTIYCYDSFYVKEVNQPNECKECDRGTIQGPNLVINGNFDLGNSGFSSDAVYNHTSALTPNHYDVVSDASTKNSAWSPDDHTGGGNLFVCDGSDQNSTKIWKQTITNLKPNTRYVFCAWARNLVLPPNNMNDPELALQINSVQIGGSLTLTESQGWRAGSVFWNSGSSTTAVIEITLNTHVYGGNDVGLDDISFSECINTKCKECEGSRMGPCLVTNNSFELGNTGFTSNATFSSTYPLTYGQYSIVTNAVNANSNWIASAPSGTGSFLVCDGLVNQETIVWSQDIINLTEWKQFIFCCWIKNLDKPNSGLSNPKIQLRISRWNGTNWDSPVIIGLVREPTTAMGWTELSETWGSNASTKARIEIVSAANSSGQGNDIGLDDICFQEVLEQVDFSSATITLSTMNVTASGYNIQATQPNLPPDHSFDWPDGDCGYWWQVCELDNNNNCITGTIVENPANWWTFPSTNFPGFNGTSPGTFKIGKKYRISYGVWCRCLSWNSSSWIISFGKGEKLSVLEDKNYKPTIQNK